MMRRRELVTQVSLFLPAFILLLVFMVTPFLMAIGLSFTNQRLIPGPVPTRFVGWQNYLMMLSDSQFWAGLKNNFVFVLVVVPLQSAFALALALLVNAKLRFTRFFRTLYFMPTVTTMVVVSVIWSFLYHPDGLVNSLLSSVSFGHWEAVDFLRNRSWAFPAIMFMSIWQGVGFQMLIFLAGLQEIPEFLYEAADVDGASPIRKFWHITLPGLRNTITFVLVSTTILAFRLFDQVMVMTAGGPQDATYTVMLHMYNTAFRRLNIGYASAMTIAFFLIVLAVSVAQRFVLWEEKEG
ncbi:MAG: sugar ABC transporter permease [Bacillota bacterium]|nr:sugar ABC transporter permease [Bacillota bacterium]